MRVVQSDSYGSAQFIALAVALVNWVQGQHPGDKRELEKLCERLWPGCHVYQGHTHMRVALRGADYQRHLDNGGAPGSCSFYVDLSGQRREP